MNVLVILAIAAPSFLAMGIGLQMLQRLSYGARGPDVYDAFYTIVRALSWILILIAIVPLLLVGFFSVVGIIVIAYFATLSLEMILVRRASLRRTSCSLLSLAAGSGADIGPAVVRVGAHDRGIVGWATRRLMMALDRGMPLAEAIRRFPGALPREARAYVEAGEVIGAQSEALRDLGDFDDSEVSTLWRACADRAVYLSTVALVMVSIAAFMMIKIAPEYQKIFSDFSLELPLVTQFVFGVSNWMANYWYVIGLPLVWIVPFIIICAILYLCDVPALQPLTDRLFRPALVSHVLRILALTAERRHALDPVLERLAQVFPARIVRRKLARVHAAVTAGRDWRDALLDHRLISRAEHALLGTAQEVGNLPWALRQIAARGQRRLVYRWTTFVQVVFPAVILALGAAIGVFIVGMFVPLITLVEGLA